MIKAVIFDIDDTLYDWRGVHDAAFQRVTDYARETLGADPEDLKQFYKAQTGLLEPRLSGSAASHNRLIRFLRYLEARHLPLRYARILERIYWEGILELARPEPGIRETLERLQKAGYCLGIGSNMTLDWQLAKLEKLGLMDFFSFVAVSEEAGAEKPDEKLFTLCLEKAGVMAYECVFVGDSFKGDVVGALKAGMNAVWYAPGRTDFGEVRGISHFSELETIISEM